MDFFCDAVDPCHEYDCGAGVCVVRESDEGVKEAVCQCPETFVNIGDVGPCVNACTLNNVDCGPGVCRSTGNTIGSGGVDFSTYFF